MAWQNHDILPTASRRSRQIFLTLAASLGVQTHKRDVKCAFLQGDMDEQHVDDNDDEDFNVDSAQHVSDTCCGPVPELTRKLQLEHHQCVRFLEAVHGLVNAPRRWCHRVATEFRHMEKAKNLSCNPAYELSESKMALCRPCAWCMLMISCSRAVTP